MTSRSRSIARLAVGTLLIAMHVTCGSDNPSSPSPPPGPAATSLVIAGSGSFTVLKQTTQLTATATFADGSSQNVTAMSQTRWTSTDESVVKVSAGLVTAQGFGTAIVVAEFQDQSAGLDMRVLPEGTFILAGQVSEPVGQLIDGARVDVTGGGGIAPRSAVTGFGYYQFQGLSGSVKVTVSLNGYVTQSKTVTMSQDQGLDFELTPTTPPANVAGTYQLTFTASGSCGIQLPSDLSTRTYTADVRQSGAGLTVTLSGASFVRARLRDILEPPVLSNLFVGRIHQKSVTFSLGHSTFFGNYFDVAENVGTQFLAIYGEADGTVTGSTMTGQMAGTFDVFDTAPPRGNPIRTCTAGDHRFSFEK